MSFNPKFGSARIRLIDGEIDGIYNNKYNFTSSLYHEYIHQEQYSAGFPDWNPLQELNALYHQSKHPSFSSITSGYKSLMKKYVEENMPLLIKAAEKYEGYNYYINKYRNQLNKAYETEF
jgi:hypothetical protein